MVTIDTDPMELEIRNLLRESTDLNSTVKLIETGTYNVRAIKGINIYVSAGFPEALGDIQFLNGRRYRIPMNIDMVCRFRDRETLLSDIKEAFGYVRDILEQNPKLDGLVNGYDLPFEGGEDVFGEDDNPEVYSLNITVNYDLIKGFN